MGKLSRFGIICIYFFIICICHSHPIEDTWVDDFSCNTSDAKQWSNCEIIYADPVTQETPDNHGPYSSNLEYDTLSRSFECKYVSNLNISFHATADCFFDANDSLTVSLNDDPYDIRFTNASSLLYNDSTCNDEWIQQFFTVSNAPNEGSKTFGLTFAVDSSSGRILLSNIQIDCILAYIPQTRDSVLFGLSWSSLAAVVYFSLYALLLCGLAVSVAIKKNYNGIKEFFKNMENEKYLWSCACSSLRHSDGYWSYD
eukprot:945055_1